MSAVLEEEAAKVVAAQLEVWHALVDTEGAGGRTADEGALVRAVRAATVTMVTQRERGLLHTHTALRACWYRLPL